MADPQTPAPQDPSKLKISGPQVPEAKVKRPIRLSTVGAGIFLTIFTVAGFVMIWNQANQDIKDTK